MTSGAISSQRCVLRKLLSESTTVLAVVLCLSCGGGGSSPSAPTPSPSPTPSPTPPPASSNLVFSGNYTLEVRIASTACGWPVLTHQWPVTVRDNGQSLGYYIGDVILAGDGFRYAFGLTYGYEAPHQLPGNGFRLGINMGPSRTCGPVTSDRGYRICMLGNVISSPPVTRVGSRPEVVDAPFEEALITWHNSPSGQVLECSDTGPGQIARASLRPR